MAGNHKFVFLVRGHVVLVAVAYTQESVTQVSHYYYHYFTQYIIGTFLFQQNPDDDFQHNMFGFKKIYFISSSVVAKCRLPAKFTG